MKLRKFKHPLLVGIEISRCCCLRARSHSEITLGCLDFCCNTCGLCLWAHRDRTAFTPE